MAASLIDVCYEQTSTNNAVCNQYLQAKWIQAKVRLRVLIKRLLYVHFNIFWGQKYFNEGDVH